MFKFENTGAPITLVLIVALFLFKNNSRHSKIKKFFVSVILKCDISIE